MKIEIKSKEYEICNIQNNVILFSTELNNKIACSFFSVQLGKVGSARAINKEQLKQLIKELNPTKIIKDNLIQVRIIGGDETQKSQKYLESLIDWLKEVDNNANIINIINFDTCYRFHPHSFVVDCYHGEISAL